MDEEKKDEQSLEEPASETPSEQPAGGAEGSQPAGGSFERQMIQGDWECSECGTKITELPFQPSEGRPIFCRECYRNKRPPRRDFRR